MSTIDYYNTHAKDYIEQTFTVDMKAHYQLFLKFIPSQGSILDLGCGSGRDALYFKKHGYIVLAIDPIDAFVAHARLLGIEAQIGTAETLHDHDCFDGIWACASLLHLNKEELKVAFKCCYEALKNNGVLYASFKYGDFEGMEGERYYTYLTPDHVQDVIGDFTIESLTLSSDNLGNREIQWLNLLLKKEEM